VEERAGERRGVFIGNSPLLNPLPARSSRGEEEAKLSFETVSSRLSGHGGNLRLETKRQKLLQKRTKQTKSFYQNPVAAEVTRLIHQENWSLLTSAATVLKWLQRSGISFLVSFCSTPCRRVFIRSIFSCRTGLSCSGGTGAEAGRLFLTEPDTRKTRLTKVAKSWRERRINSNPEGILAATADFAKMRGDPGMR
jgi:hypothetical protein